MAVQQKVEYQRLGRYYSALEPLLERPKVRAYTMLTLSLLALSFFGYFAIRPTLATISTLRRQITDARFVDQKLQEKINALSAISLEYEALKPDIALVWTALPLETKFPSFVKKLEKLAADSDVTIGTITFKPVDLAATSTEATISAKEVPISFVITLGGNYTNLANFVGRLSHFERLIVIERLRLVSGGEKERISLALDGRTFYVK